MVLESPKKLFVAYVGGKTKTSNIELHDIRFVVGHTIEDCYHELQSQWWGTPESLHLDCWGQLTQADGYTITLHAHPFSGPEKLYFLNLGGYDINQFTELHHNIFIVEETETKARVKALKHIQNWQAPHKDAQIEIETAICISDSLQSEKLYLHLDKTNHQKPFSFVCKYTPIKMLK